MDLIHDRAAGLDVHKDSVVACVRAMSGKRATRECRTYATTTEGLLALLEWLNSEGAAWRRWRRPGCIGFRSGRY